MKLTTPDLSHLPLMIYKDQPVATTEMLAQFYGTEPRNLRRNFDYQKARFELGKHYITLEGQELKGFTSCATNTGSPFAPSKFATRVNLWTERGAARHAKMLETDQAWDVWEAMEDAYFRRGSSEIPPMLGVQPTETQTPEHYAAESARLYAELERLKQIPIAVMPDVWEQSTDPMLRVGKKVHVVRELVCTLEAIGVSREVAKQLTGHTSNTVRQHVFQGKPTVNTNERRKS